MLIYIAIHFIVLDIGIALALALHHKKKKKMDTIIKSIRKEK